MITTISLPESTIIRKKILQMNPNRRNSLLLAALKAGIRRRRFMPTRQATKYNPKGCRHQIIRICIPDEIFRIAVSFRCFFRISISRLITEFLETTEIKENSYSYSHQFIQRHISAETIIFTTKWEIHPRKARPPH